MLGFTLVQAQTQNTENLWTQGSRTHVLPLINTYTKTHRPKDDYTCMRENPRHQWNAYQVSYDII